MKSVSIVGAGNLGRVLALCLQKAGFTVREIISRDEPNSRRRAAAIAKATKSRYTTLSKANFDADIVWLCVTDDAIAATATQLAKSGDWRGKIVFHSSGALPASELSALKARGASTASVHPMNTFVTKSKPDLIGTPFALEGDMRAVTAAAAIASRLNRGAQVFTIKAEAKVLYHAMGSFASPLLVSLLTAAERVASGAGIKQPQMVLKKILLTTVENYLENGAAAAFSGPIQRGDVTTVKKHLVALNKFPQAQEVYLALARNAVASLTVKARQKMKKTLAGI